MRKPTQQAPRNHFKQDEGMAGMAWVQTMMLAALACAALLVVMPTEAAPASSPDVAAATARYQQDRAACNSGHANQDRATCLKEAGAAYAEAKRGGLKVAGGGTEAWAANTQKRCVGLPAEESKACMARIQGAGSRSGSVESGGILRELVTVQPAASSASNSAATTSVK